MTDLNELVMQRKATTDPMEYDRLSAQIAAAHKANDLTEARKAAEEKARRKAERDRTLTEYKKLTGEIETGYKNIQTMDKTIFETVKTFVETAQERLNLSANLLALEDQARVIANSLGMKFTGHEPAFIGAQPLHDDLNSFIKTWLQRFIDWAERLGESPTLETISGHGLRGGTEREDQPWNF